MFPLTKQGSSHTRRRKGTRRSGRRGSDPGGEENDDEEKEEGMDEEEDEEGDADALRKLGVSTHRRPGVRRGKVKSGAMSGGPSKVSQGHMNFKTKNFIKMLIVYTIIPSDFFTLLS